MSYAVKEIFYTLQGEGAHAGRPAVFCRFAGCNLWTGREAGPRQRGLPLLRHRLRRHRRHAAAASSPTPRRWPRRSTRSGRPTAARPAASSCCTGGEPLLQLDAALIAALHARGFEIAVETNGTLAAPPGIDWLCVSPKAGAPLVAARGRGAEGGVCRRPGSTWPTLERGWTSRTASVQPMDGPERAANTELGDRAGACEHPRWQLSLQTHKITRHPLKLPCSK